jgi:hypothetical protein
MISLIKSALGFVTGFKTTFIAVAIATALSGATGWYLGVRFESRIIAAASVSAAEKARKKQADYDQRNWTNAKADYETRHTADTAANRRLQDIIAKGPKVVTHTITTPSGVVETTPQITKDSMKALNDPALVGVTQ